MLELISGMALFILGIQLLFSAILFFALQTNIFDLLLWVFFATDFTTIILYGLCIRQCDKASLLVSNKFMTLWKLVF